MHCPSAPSLIAGGDPTDCMYNGDVTLTADALQSFEGIITASGDLTITGTTLINFNGDLTLNGGSINIDTPINTNGDLIINSTTGNIRTLTLNDLDLRGATTSTFTLNLDSTLTLTAGSTSTSIPPLTITTGSIRTITTPLTISTDTVMLPISAGDLILSAATSSSPARMFIFSEGQSLTAGSTLTATDGTTLTLSEGDELILTSSTFSTTPIVLTGNLELVDINGNPITLQATEEDTNNPTANNSSNTGAIVGGISGGVVLLTSIVYWFWPSDKAPLARFQAFNADAYLPTRQWIGMEHALTENIKFAVGSFWLSDGTVNTITPSMNNTGVDVRLSLAPRGFGEFSFSAAAYNYKDTDSQYKEDGTTTDLFLDNFQVSNERLEFGYALGLQWRASF